MQFAHFYTSMYSPQQQPYAAYQPQPQPQFVPLPPPSPAKRAKLSSPASEQETRFLSQAQHKLQTEASSAKAWQDIQSLARMNLLAKGWNAAARPTAHTGAQALAKHDAAFPRTMAVVFDLLELDPSKRVLAINEVARQLLGPICRDEQGLDSAKLLAGNTELDAWRMLEALVAAFRTGEEEEGHATSVRVRLTTEAFSQVFVLHLRALRQEQALLIYGAPE